MTLQSELRRLAMAFSAAVLYSATVQAQQAAVPADEMSSVEWRDCAGYFFYLSRNISKEVGDSKSELDKQLLTMLNGWGLMAVYASEEKARVEASEGKQPPLGRSLRDPTAGGQLKFDIDAQVASHEAKIQSEGKSPYVMRYKEKCEQPVTAFSARFVKARDSSKKS